MKDSPYIKKFKVINVIIRKEKVALDCPTSNDLPFGTDNSNFIIFLSLNT